MSTILVINSSVLGDGSVSRPLVEKVVDQLRSQDPSAKVIERDLAAAPVPHVDGTVLAGLFGGEAPDQAAARERSDVLVGELKQADTIVIGAPMYNFAIPSMLKAWFDHVLRAGLTFRYTEQGPQGLLTGKRAIVVSSRGGVYSEGPLAAIDFQEPHLRTLLNFIGVTDITFVRAEGLKLSPEAKDAAIAAAEAQIAGLPRSEVRKAA